MIRYDTRRCFNVRSKYDILSQLNLPHGTKKQKVEKKKKVKNGYAQKYWSTFPFQGIRGVSRESVFYVAYSFCIILARMWANRLMIIYVFTSHLELEVTK